MQKLPTASEISSALTEAEEHEAHSYSSVFSKKSQEREDGWFLLQGIFDLHERLEDAGQPFAAMMTLVDGRRIFLPEELSKDQLEWLRQLEAEIDDPEYCARVADLLWLCADDRKLAAGAVRYYLDAGLALEDLEHWTESIARYTRAYRLATQLGRKSQLRTDVLKFLVERLRIVKGDDPRWWSMKIISLLYEARHGDHSELIDYANTAARRAAGESDFRRQRDYLEIIAKLHHRNNAADISEEVRVAIARSYRYEAEAAEENGGGLKAHHHWEAAIRAYRERPSLRTEVPELQTRMAAAGLETIKSMQSLSHSTDISEIVEGIRGDFCGQSTDAALYNFVSFPLTNPDDLQREVEESKQGTFSAMFNSRFFDYEGRTVAIAPGALTSDDPGYGQRTKSDIQRHMSLRRNISVQAQISVALRIITSEHVIDAAFLSERLADSAFIPEGRLDHIVEGLIFGFNWQFSHAAHILVPQFEAGLRSIATQLGLTPRNLNASGVEDAWGLDRLLSEEPITSHLGENLTFELRSLLIKDYGPKFRHNLSHGLIPPKALASTDAVYAWWLFLHLCVVPTVGFHTFASEGRKPSPD